MLAGPYVNTDGTTSGAGTGAGAEEGNQSIPNIFQYHDIVICQ